MLERNFKGGKKYRWMVLITSILLLSVVIRLDFARAVELDFRVKNPDRLINAVGWGPVTFEPAWASDTMSVEVLSSCYDTLIAYDREKVDSFVPRLATEVPTIENGGITDNGLTYRFHIRSGVKFWFGFPLTPEDIEYTFERAMVRDIGYPIGLLLVPLTGYYSTRDSYGDIIPGIIDSIMQAVEVDGNDVVFHLARPYAPFMHILASWFSSIVSKQECIDNGDWPGTEETWEDYNNLNYSPLDEATMGTGPFRLESWTPEEVVLARNDLYWRGPAKLEKVIFKIIVDANTRVQMLIEGDTDFCTVPRDLYSELEGIEGIRLFENLLSLVVWYLDINFAISDNSPYIGSGSLDGNGIPLDFFDDIDIRKAFAYAFDYDTVINERYFGEALQPASPVIEGLPFHNPDQPKYTFDLDQAEGHFRQAWGGQVWDTGFKCTIVYNEGNMNRKALMEMLEVSIESLNPKFHIEVLGISWFDYLMALWSGQLPMSLWGWGADFPDPENIVRALMHSEFTSGYSNPLVDYLIDEGVGTLDPAERQAIYYELQSIYHDDVIDIPLAQSLSRHYERDWIQGWYHNPGAPTDYYSIWKGDDNLVNMLITHVEDLVDSGVLKHGAGNSLIKKLESVIALLDKGNLHGASQKLNDFIDLVEALIRSGRLLVEEGQELIALAQEIIELLGAT